jgi:hypothetical protein
MTVIVHDVPASKLRPQVWVVESPPSLSWYVMLLMLSVVLPTLVSVMDPDLPWPDGTNPKSKLTGMSFTIVPTPLSEMACWPGALPVIERLAVRALMPVGLNVTLIVQVAPGANEPLQVLAWAKSRGSAPVKPIPVILSSDVP